MGPGAGAHRDPFARIRDDGGEVQIAGTLKLDDVIGAGTVLEELDLIIPRAWLEDESVIATAAFQVVIVGAADQALADKRPNSSMLGFQPARSRSGRKEAVLRAWLGTTLHVAIVTKWSDRVPNFARLRAQLTRYPQGERDSNFNEFPKWGLMRTTQNEASRE